MSEIILRLDSGVEIVIDSHEQTIDCTMEQDLCNKVTIAFCEWDEVDEFVRNQKLIAKKNES